MGCEPLDLPCFSGGYAVTALQGPTHVAAGDGALFVADTGNHRGLSRLGRSFVLQ